MQNKQKCWELVSKFDTETMNFKRTYIFDKITKLDWILHGGHVGIESILIYKLLKMHLVICVSNVENCLVFHNKYNNNIFFFHIDLVMCALNVAFWLNWKTSSVF